jgi:hypothetical protein
VLLNTLFVEIPEFKFPISEFWWLLFLQIDNPAILKINDRTTKTS